MGPEFTFAIQRFAMLRKKATEARLAGTLTRDMLTERNDALAEAISLLLQAEQECGNKFPSELIERRKGLQQVLAKWRGQVGTWK